MLKPTAALRFKMAPEFADADTASLIQRTYSYVAPTDVVAANPSQNSAEPVNTVCLQVRFENHPYWKSSDRDADEMWNEIVLPWLENKLAKLQNTINASNKVSGKADETPLSFAFLELEMQPYSFISENKNGDTFTDVIAALVHFRKLVNEASELEGATRIKIPWQNEDSTSLWEVELEDGTSLQLEPRRESLGSCPTSN